MSAVPHFFRPRDVDRGRRVLLAASLIVAAGLLAYANSFSGALIFDDFPAIRDNATIRALWPPARALSPPANSGVGGRPLANLSFALNYAFGGTAITGYHGVNLLLHLGSALLLFGIVRRTLRTPGPTWFAAAISAIWVAHPLTTAAVTWLSQRTELLMAFFYLLTLYAFIRGTDPGQRRWLAASVSACFLGMLSKEVMLTAPILVLLYDRTFVAGSVRAAWHARRSYYVALAASWGALAWSLTTGLGQRSVGFGLGVSAWKYAVAEFHAVLTYAKLCVWPAPLVFDYGAIYPPLSFTSFAAMVVIVSCLLVAWWGLSRRSTWGFATAAFFLLLAPTSTFVPIAEQPMAENRAYLPLAAVTVLAATAVHAILAPVGRRACLLVLLPLLALTVARNATYRQELFLWADTVARRPANSRAHYNLGVVLLDAGRPAEAAASFERAIALKPLEPKAHNSLGNALLELGRPGAAIPHFAEAVRLDPRYARAWCNYGTALLRQGAAEAAVSGFEHAVRLDPSDASAEHGLGNAYFQLQQPSRAIAHYEAALRLDPALADVYYSCGNACAELGRLDEAIRHFAAAVRLKPRDAEIRNNHGAALLRTGRVADAITEFEMALRLHPGYADARDNLNVARSELARQK